GRRRMAVGIDEARNHGLAGQIELLRAHRGQAADLLIRTDGKEAAAGDRHGVGMGARGIDRVDIAVQQYQFGLRGGAPGEAGASQSPKKIAAFHCLITSPPFMTNVTRSSSVMSRNGSPGRATISANLPASIAPRFAC